jgi:hypothetical protein
VFFLDISRTVPLDGTIGYAKLAKLATREVSSSEIGEDFRKRLSHILGRDYHTARFAKSNADDQREIGLLKSELGEISQFHQGAGEWVRQCLQPADFVAIYRILKECADRIGGLFGGQRVD